MQGDAHVARTAFRLIPQHGKNTHFHSFAPDKVKIKREEYY